MRDELDAYAALAARARLPAYSWHTRIWLEVRPGTQARARERASVPDWLMRNVLEPVLADLQRPRPVELIVELEPGDDGALVVFSERGQRGSFGLRVPDQATPRAGLLVAWADQLQEQFFPETQAAWGEARPECPGHPHPAQNDWGSRCSKPRGASAARLERARATRCGGVRLRAASDSEWINAQLLGTAADRWRRRAAGLPADDRPPFDASGRSVSRRP